MTFESATDMLVALRARTVSAVELVDQAVREIEGAPPALNAVVVHDFERARAQAAEADAARARGDERPLLGLPMTVKESFNVAGLPTTWGIGDARAEPQAHDAVAVARLRNAGAIVLGKSNIATGLADWQSTNPVYGTTGNPWDLARTPGGSSGGAAAALAAGLVPLELGSDLAGSLRVPAHCCGVFAHKPTHGLVPMRGHAPPGTPLQSVAPPIDLAVVGPMARCARDLTLALDVLAGPDDAEATGYRLSLPAARHDRLADFRVLMLDRHPMAPLGREVRAALEHFASRVEGARCRLATHSDELPDLMACTEVFTHLLMSFIGADMPPSEYAALVAQAAALPPQAALDPTTAPLRGLVSSHRDWIAMDRRRHALRDRWRQLFRRWDVVVCPVMPTVAFAHDQRPLNERVVDVDGQPMPYGWLGIWSALASLAGLPATVMPVGDGDLPVGLQIIGPQLEDRTPLRFAELFEAQFGGFRPPPLLAGAQAASGTAKG